MESIDGVATIQEISDLHGLHVELVQRIVLFFAQKGLLEIPEEPVEKKPPPQDKAAVRKRWEKERAARALKRLMPRPAGPRTPERIRKKSESAEVQPSDKREASPEADIWSNDAESKKQLAHLTESEKLIPK